MTAIRRSGCRSRHVSRAVLLTGFCAVAGLVATPTLGADVFDGTYAGTRVLTKGEANVCPAKEDVSVAIHGDVLTFTNSQLRNFAIGFDPHPDGSFGQIHADVGGRSVLIRGRIVADVLDADITNGACEHHWHLKKQGGS